MKSRRCKVRHPYTKRVIGWGHQELLEDGTWTECEFGPIETKILKGTIHPNYLITSVLYAPPGKKGGKGGSDSSVTYAEDSTLGFKVSATRSFEHGNTVSASVGLAKPITANVGVEFTIGESQSDSQSLEVKKTTSSQIKFPGPSDADGINHDYDRVYLWIKPSIQVTIDATNPNKPSIQWEPNPNSGLTAYVYVGWLKNPDAQREEIKSVLRQLEEVGITRDVYPEILKADPFAVYGTEVFEEGGIDINRFDYTGATVPYMFPYETGGSPGSNTNTISNSVSEGGEHREQDSYSVRVSIEAGVDFLKIWKASVKEQYKWTWTNSSSESTTTETKESASYTIGGPSEAYSGSIWMKVYYDVIYRTFLFVPRPMDAPIYLQGTVLTLLGKPARGEQVVVKAKGREFRTFTNHKGEYFIFDKIAAPFEIGVGRRNQVLKEMPTSNRVDLNIR